jgi:hypothetical protein
MNGTSAEVASFFRKDPHTLNAWNRENPPRIGFIKEGKHYLYLEHSILSYALRHYQLGAEELLPDESVALKEARLTDQQRLQILERAWRRHINARRADVVGEQIKALDQRLERIEGLLLRWVPSARPQQFEEVA